MSAERKHRWLEVSVACACGESVSVYSSCPQPPEGDDEVFVEELDYWRCDAGHAGSVYIQQGRARLSPAVGAPRPVTKPVADIESLVALAAGLPELATRRRGPLSGAVPVEG